MSSPCRFWAIFPILGALFRRRTELDTPRYLLIFVTATIVKDTGEFLVYEDENSATNSPAVTTMSWDRPRTPSSCHAEA